MNEKNYKMNKRRLGVFKYAAIGAAVMVLAKIAVILRRNPKLLGLRETLSPQNARTAKK